MLHETDNKKRYIFYRGAFSVVKKVVDKTTQQEFAVKIINTKKLVTRGTQLGCVNCVYRQLP